MDGKPKQEYMDEIKKKMDEVDEKKKARAAAQTIVQPEMKIEFKSTEGDKNLFTQPVAPVLNDSTKVVPVNVTPNQKPE
jgi:hypothetical protein